MVPYRLRVVPLRRLVRPGPERGDVSEVWS